LCQKSQYSYFVGQQITEIKHEISESSNLLAQLKASINLHCHQIFHQRVLNLLSQEDSLCLLFTASQEDNLLERATKVIFKLKKLYFFNLKITTGQYY
jgi:hypothetical protein